MGATIGANVGESGQILKITVEAKFKTLLDGQQGTPEGLEAVAGHVCLRKFRVEGGRNFGHLMQRADSLEKTLMLGGIGDRRRRGRQQSPGREAALAWASLAQRFPASSVLAREGAGCGSVGDVPGVTGAWLASAPLWPSLWT